MYAYDRYSLYIANYFGNNIIYNYTELQSNIDIETCQLYVINIKCNLGLHISIYILYYI